MHCEFGTIRDNTRNTGEFDKTYYYIPVQCNSENNNPIVTLTATWKVDKIYDENKIISKLLPSVANSTSNLKAKKI